MGWRTPIEEPVEVVRDALAPLRNGISVAAYALGNEFSVGAIIRVAHSFLVREIILVGSTPFYPKASMGMEKYERVVRVADEEAFLEHVGPRPLVALEGERARGNFYLERVFPDDAVFLFGSERHGLPASLLAHAHRVLALPMYGVNHSFPVAVAAGMVLGEWARRRYAPGTVC